VTKWIEPNKTTRQPILKGIDWFEDFNPSTRSGLSCLDCQLDGPKYGSVHPGLLACLKK